jgi:hypothetical protein
MAELEDDDLVITPQDIAYTIGWMMNTHRRLYDVLLAILSTNNADKAKELHQLHEDGLFLFPPPWVDGEGQ